jgi:hypothetical protein
MNIHQRDIVEIAFYIGNKPETHPAIVISVDEIFEMEGFFYAILLSTKNIYPDFTFQITSDMINSPRNQRTGASLKMDTFQKVVNKVQEVVFGISK